jgi:hydrogenase/urease accessory protein HupE
MRRLLTLALAAAAALALPASALAHGVHGEAQTIPEFIWLGIRHMVGGWDHLLFIAGIVLLARSFLRAAKLISLFVAGHSTTLLVATLAGWNLNPDAVDVVIALSVAYIGWRNLRGPPSDWRSTGAIIFAFGLIHGLGLSTRLQELPLPEGGALVARILAFNLGVEIGQLLALAVIVVGAVLVMRPWPGLRRTGRYAALGLISFGVIAAGIFSFLALRPGEDSVTASTETTATDAAVTTGSCIEEDYTPNTSEAALGGHLDRVFFEPDEQAVRADLQHVLGDGYVIVVYKRSLPADRRAELRAWVEQAPATVGVPGATTMNDSLEALTARKRVRCTAFDLAALTDFRTRWFTTGG